VSAREGLEAVHEFAASAAVGVRADVGSDEHPVGVYDVGHDGVDERLLDAAEVGLAAREQVGTRLSEEELHALRDEESGCERERETHPANVPLPELPTPDECLGGSPASGRAGDEDHAHDEDDGGGREERDDDEQPCWNGLLVLKGVRYVEIDGRKGSVEWVDVFPSSTDSCDCAESC
jgi:hypothetical protein